MKSILQNYGYRTMLEDRTGKKFFYIYSNRPLNNDEVIDAARDESWHVSVIPRLHPEYRAIWKTVDVHFGAPRL